MEYTPPPPLEQQLLNYVNMERAAQQPPLVALLLDEAMRQIAMQRAAQQLRGQGLSHYGPGGELLFTGMLGQAGVPYRVAGENLALAQAERPEALGMDVHQAWMASPTHRANVLGDFERMAVGQAVGGDGQTAIAQLFRR